LNRQGLLSQAKVISDIRKQVKLSATRVTEQQKLLEHIELWNKCEFNPSSLSQLVEDINSNDRLKQYRGTIGVSKLLGKDEAPIQQAIEMKLIPRMIEFLQRKEEPQLQIKAAWILANALSGTTAQTEMILDQGVIFWFINILYSKNQELREKSSWALGNIAGDSPVLRDRLIASGALAPLLKVVEDPEATLDVIREGVYAISNLCRGRPLPPVDKVKSAIPTLCKAIQSQTELQVLTDASWALSYLTRTEATAQMLVDVPNAISALIPLLSTQDLALLVPSLRTLGNICTGDEAQTDAVIRHPEFFEKLWNIIDHKKKAVRRETMWILSNIAAGNEKQRDQLFKSFPFAEKLVSCIENDLPEVQREALWVVFNALKQEVTSEFWLFWNAGLLRCYISILRMHQTDSPSLLKILEGIYYMLNVGKKMAIENNTGSEENMVLVELEKGEVLEKFDGLQDSDDEDICEIVRKIIQGFIPTIEIKSKREESEDYDDGEGDFDDSEDEIFNYT